mmetsp:Transcript_84410/g.239933  ORF Transcript_84410/g.239933 Transcript_84410/m.239933 type:complete len:371 (+) Transcript_84410:1071-2183(+)
MRNSTAPQPLACLQYPQHPATSESHEATANVIEQPPSATRSDQRQPASAAPRRSKTEGRITTRLNGFGPTELSRTDAGMLADWRFGDRFGDRSDRVTNLGGHDDVGAGLENLLDALLGDVLLALADALDLLGLVHDHLDAHLHLVALEVEVEERNLGAVDTGRHLLRCAGAVEREAVDELGLEGGAAVALEDVDGADRVARLALVVNGLDRGERLDGHRGEEVRLRAEDLRGHGGAARVEENIVAELVSANEQVVLDVLNSLAHGKTVARHNRGRVDLVLDELVGALEELRRDDDHRGGTISHFLVLEVRQLDEHLGVVDTREARVVVDARCVGVVVVRGSCFVFGAWWKAAVVWLEDAPEAFGSRERAA